jgi:ABC-2 type transport system ATP-binding protein
VGLNGAGKTTLLTTFYGLLKPDSGTIKQDNQPLNKQAMAYLETHNYFYPKITGREYLSLFANPDFDPDQWNQLFRLPLDDLVDTYSTGMKKQLALLRTLKQDKPFMILDEPFNGLDIEAAINIRSMLNRLKDKGKTILITSHIIETLTNLCDHLHYLESGQILYSRDSSQSETFKQEIIDHVQEQNEHLLRQLLD